MILADKIPVYCAYDELVDITAIIPNPRNPNTHPQKQIELLARIIKNQGWRAPITVSNRSGFVVRGHGRLLAAQFLGVGQVPVDRQDYATEAEEIFDMLIDSVLTSKNDKIERPNVRKGEEKLCQLCSMPFYVHPSEKHYRYCSSMCGYIARSKYPLKSYFCETCGVLFYAKEKPKSNNSNKYCSHNCRDKAYRKRMVGKNNPFWQGGINSEKKKQRQRAAYLEWRAAVFERDKYTCQQCGKRGGRLHAHHKKSFARHLELRTDLNNGITLCIKCHGRIHGIKFAGKGAKQC